MKYLLDYLEQEMFITPVEGTIFETEEEYAADNIPIGERIILNNKDVDIVVWYADYDKWLEKKYVELLNKYENE
jgi:hypothetical protein